MGLALVENFGFKCLPKNDIVPGTDAQLQSICIAVRPRRETGENGIPETKTDIRYTGQLSCRTSQLHLLCLRYRRQAQERHHLRHSHWNCGDIFEHNEERSGAHEEGLWKLVGDLRVGDGADDGVRIGTGGSIIACFAADGALYARVVMTYLSQIPCKSTGKIVV